MRSSINADSELRGVSFWQRHLLVATMLVASGPSAMADLIGSTVTVDLSLGGGGNLYDPANGLQECQSSPTTTFTSGNGFCALDYAYDGYFTSFSSTGFTFTEQAEQNPFPSPITLTLTDTAFTGASLNPNAYPPDDFSGLTYGIEGDVITIDIPGQPFYASPDLVASFDIFSDTTVPEPGFAGLLLMVIGSMALLARRTRPDRN